MDAASNLRFQAKVPTKSPVSKPASTPIMQPVIEPPGRLKTLLLIHSLPMPSQRKKTDFSAATKIRYRRQGTLLLAIPFQERMDFYFSCVALRTT
ncbi:hypothetical protein [Rhodothermus profundi]|uniref:Uncharacterized protein n=1 Tax=Rhodothermus profundi TaxID=633813 RepID=A0A1M6XXU4_9BACT|nr:hypothetical protein [Rhodothermus profundi]SHL10668.1 hypothetical protein SAMN04488087_2724 [Rhodothermus profundi]